MALTRVYETVLYTRDLGAAARFYGEVVGLPAIVSPDAALLAGFRLPDGGVLLVFDRTQSERPGRLVPSHGMSGEGHIAFSVDAGTLAGWRGRLEANGVEIERTIEWGSGSRSFYVRDPAGNSVEFVDGELWQDAG